MLIISWLIYGVVVGSLARWIYRGNSESGWIPTIATGVAGSVVGGLIHSVLTQGRENSAGIIFGVAGGVLACWIRDRWLSARET